MATIGDLRDRLRIELHDEYTERWQDGTLDRHLQRAARELAFVWPREQKSTLQTTGGSRDIDVSSLSDFVRIEAVEYPVGEHPPSYVQFSLFGGTCHCSSTPRQLALRTSTCTGAACIRSTP